MDNKIIDTSEEVLEPVSNTEDTNVTLPTDNTLEQLSLNVSESVNESQPEGDTDTTTKVVNTKPEYDDRHGVVDCYRDLKSVDGDLDTETGIIIPSGTVSEIKKFTDIIQEQDEELFKQNFGGLAGKIMFTANLRSIDQTNDKDVYKEFFEDEDTVVNDINYGDKNLGIRVLPLKNQKGKVVGENLARARFTSLLGLGETIQIPLWHSGFWITVTPPKDKELIALDNLLANNELMLGRQTNTLIYSNYGVVFNRIILDFILDHMSNTTLILPEDGDIRDYIVMHDFYPMVLGFISAIYPDGFRSTRTCNKTLIMDEEGKPLCNFTATGNLNPKRLLWLDRRQLSISLLDHMANRSPNVSTLDSVIEYQSKLTKLADKVITIKSSSGMDINITLSIPTLTPYIKNGEVWVQNVISGAEEIFTANDSLELKNGKVTDVLNTVLLGIYNVFVKRIEVNGTYVDTRFEIDEVLDEISSDNNTLEVFTNGVRDYISTSAIAVVATPKFTCPECGETHDDIAIKNKTFSDFIPLNVVENFFALSALKIDLIRKRDIIS